MEYIIAIVITLVAVVAVIWSIKRESDCEEGACRLHIKSEQLERLEISMKRLSEELRDV